MTQKEPLRITGDRLATLLAHLIDNSLPKEWHGKYHIRGYEVTIKERKIKYH